MDGEGKTGNLLKREKGIIKATWKERPCILLSGSLFYYEHQTVSYFIMNVYFSKIIQKSTSLCTVCLWIARLLLKNANYEVDFHILGTLILSNSP